MERLTLEETLADVTGRISRRFAGTANLDDLVQEARISAWKDYEQGKDLKHIRVRAKYRVMGLLNAGKPSRQMNGAHPQQWTGHLTANRDHQNHKDGEVVRQKIRQFMSEFRALHGREANSYEIAPAVGLSRATVISHLKRLYLFSGPYLETVTSIEALPGLEWKSRDNVETFVCSEVDLSRLFQEHVPNERHRTWLYMLVYEGKTYGEIGKEFGTSSAYIGQALRKILGHLKEVIVR